MLTSRPHLFESRVMFTLNHMAQDDEQEVVCKKLYERLPLKVLCLPNAGCENVLDHSVLDKITQAEQPPMELAWFAWCHNWSMSTFKKMLETLDTGLFCVINKNLDTKIQMVEKTLDKCNQVLEQQTDEAASLKQLEYAAKKQCIQLDLETHTLYDIANEFRQTGLEFCAWHWRFGKSPQLQNDIGHFLHITEKHLRALTGWEKNVLGLNRFCGIQLGEGKMNAGGWCTWNYNGWGGSTKTTTCLIDCLKVENGKVKASALMHEWAHALDRMLGSVKHLQAGNKVNTHLLSIIKMGFRDRVFRPTLSYPSSPVNTLKNPVLHTALAAIDTLFKAQAWTHLNEDQRVEKTRKWIEKTHNSVKPYHCFSGLNEMWDVCVKTKGHVGQLALSVEHIRTVWPGEPTSDYLCTVASAAEYWVKTAWLVCELEQRKKVLRFAPSDIVERLTKNMSFCPKEEAKWRTTTLTERFAQSFEYYAHPAPQSLCNTEISEKILPCENPIYKNSWEEFFQTIRPILEALIGNKIP